MKYLRHLWALGFLLNFTTHAALYTYSYAPSGGVIIPEGNVSGWQNSTTFSGISGQSITDVSVTLNVSGGYNGAFYAYLEQGSTIVVLLNRVGVGSSDPLGASGSGLSSVVLSSLALNNIHTSLGSGTTGTFAPDGRNIDPLSASSAFDSASTTANFSPLINSSPNGTWTLFFSDVVSGAGSPTLNSWELDINTVPEPVNVALGIFAGLFLLRGCAGSEWARRLFRRLP